MSCIGRVRSRGQQVEPDPTWRELFNEWRITWDEEKQARADAMRLIYDDIVEHWLGQQRIYHAQCRKCGLESHYAGATIEEIRRHAICPKCFPRRRMVVMGYTDPGDETKKVVMDEETATLVDKIRNSAPPIESMVSSAYDASIADRLIGSVLGEGKTDDQ
jgi:hypothetical protein